MFTARYSVPYIFINDYQFIDFLYAFRMGRYLRLTLILISFIPAALSFQTGAPQAACQTLAPDAIRHGAQPQVTDIPYELNLNAFYDQALDQMVYTPNTIYNSKEFIQYYIGLAINSTFPVVNMTTSYAFAI